MDSNQFDDLTKFLASSRVSRLTALRVMAGAGFGAVLGLRTTGVAAQIQGPCTAGNIFLCHKEAAGPPNNAQCVEDNAVPAHLAYGDCICGQVQGERQCVCPNPSPGTECFLFEQAIPPGTPGFPAGRAAACPPGYTGNATSPCTGECPCKRGRRCKNGHCCEKKGTHCNRGKECCSGRCKRIHDNHKQCA